MRARRGRSEPLEWTDADDADVERWYREWVEKLGGPLFHHAAVAKWEADALARFRESKR